MAVPYTFATATAPIPLSQLDSNFSTPITIGATPIALGETQSVIDQVYLTSAIVEATSVQVTGNITCTSSISAGLRLTGCNGAGGISSNFALETNSLESNTTGAFNIAFGQSALQKNTTGSQNIGIGYNALQYNITGNYNTAVGAASQLGVSTFSGSQNTSVGNDSLRSIKTGSSNNAFGYQSLYTLSTGSYNVAYGANSLKLLTTGSYNTAIGDTCLSIATTASYNVGVGATCFNALTTGSGNTQINPNTAAGVYSAVFNPTTENNRLILGSTAVTNAYVQVAWTVVSDARDKTNFAPVPHGLDFVSKLQPTAYQFTESRENPIPTGIVRYGFKAQDILELEGDNPIIIDAEDPEKLRFNSDSLIPVLVNAIKELKAELDLLKSKAGA